MGRNIVIITGNLVRDAELKATAKGLDIAEFCVAVNQKIRSGDKITKEVYYINCTLYGKRAKGAGPYLTKGIEVDVSGHWKQSRWEKDGKHCRRDYVVVSDLEFRSRSKKPAADSGEGKPLEESEIETVPIDEAMLGEEEDSGTPKFESEIDVF